MSIEDFRERRAHRSREGVTLALVTPGAARERYASHTVDVDVRYLQETLRKDRLWTWCTAWCLVGAAIGYVIGRYVLPAWVGG